MLSTHSQLIDRIKQLKLKVDEQLATQKIKFNQYDLLPNIDKYIKSNLPPEDKTNPDKSLSKDERRGLCEGLSSYYLYSKDNHRGKEFFSRLSKISQLKWNKNNALDPSLEMEFMKLTNFVRWFHDPAHFGASFHQGELDKTVETIRQDDESPFFHEFGVASFFTEEEFLDTFKQCLHTPRMVFLRTPSHAMGLYIEENKYSFYDPDFEGGCEIVLDTPLDLYAWLIYRSVKYDMSKLEQNVPLYLELSMDFFRNKQTMTGKYPGLVDFVENFILSDDQYLQRISNDKNNLLFLNCATYHPEVVFRLLKEPSILSTINDPEPYLGYTPLIFCCQKGHTDLIKALLESGADPNKANQKYDTTALQVAIDGGHLEAVKLLIQYGANTLQPTMGGSLPVFRSVSCGSFEIFEILFHEYQKNGGKINDKDQYGHSLLLKAVESRNFQMVDFLLNQGADPHEIEMSRGDTLVGIASEKGDIEIIQLLLKHGANIHASPEHPILAAASHGKLDVVRYFLDSKDLMPQPEVVKKALQTSINNGQLHVANYLINNYHLICDGDALMYLLSRNKKPEVYHFIQLAIKSGADVIKYDVLSNHSLASWALSNKSPKLDEEKVCINLILNKLEEDPVAKFVAFATQKTNELKNKLSQESSGIQNNVQTSWFLSNYYQNEYESHIQKINALSTMISVLTRDPQKSIGEIVKQIEVKFPSFLSGIINHPEKDLVSWIEQGQKELLQKIQYKK